MKKIITLKESDLVGIIKRVINESSRQSCPTKNLIVKGTKTQPVKHNGCATNEVPCGPQCCPQGYQCVQGAYCQHNTTCEVIFPHNPINPY